MKEVVVSSSEERIAEIAESLMRDEVIEDVFDRSVGPSEECYSPRRIVSVLQGGASAEDMKHLVSCPACLKSVKRLGELNLDTNLDGLRQLMNQEEPIRRIRHPKSVMKPLPGIISLNDAVINVQDPFASDIRVVLTFIPAFNQPSLDRIDSSSLRLLGAIEASQVEISEEFDFDSDGKSDALQIAFSGCRLRANVRDGLAHRQRVFDTVQLVGRLDGDDGERFVGQATVEFSPLADTSR